MRDASLPRTLGQRIARLRHARGMTQLVLSARTGLSVEYLSRLENGKANPTVLTLWSLCRGLGCALHDLME